MLTPNTDETVTIATVDYHRMVFILTYTGTAVSLCGAAGDYQVTYDLACVDDPPNTCLTAAQLAVPGDETLQVAESTVCTLSGGQFFYSLALTYWRGDGTDCSGDETPPTTFTDEHTICFRVVVDRTADSGIVPSSVHINKVTVTQTAFSSVLDVRSDPTDFDPTTTTGTTQWTDETSVVLADADAG